MQNDLHGGANGGYPFAVQEAIEVCSELVASLRSVLANDTGVAGTLTIIRERYHSCSHSSRSFGRCPVATTVRELYNLHGGAASPALNPTASFSRSGFGKSFRRL